MDCAGTHLIADLWGCRGLDDLSLVEDALRDAATAANATVLQLHVHGFGERAGVTGVALLAESHITIHSWPEHGYAACDIFLCGRLCAAEPALEALAERLSATRRDVHLIPRGRPVPTDRRLVPSPA